MLGKNNLETCLKWLESGIVKWYDQSPAKCELKLNWYDQLDPPPLQEN
jgi:hypothetical protein